MRRRSTRRRYATRAFELAVTAPQVVALRALQAHAAGGKPGARERREWTRMSTEKVDAFSRSAAAMNVQWIRAAFELPLVLAYEWMRWWMAAATPMSRSRPRRNRTAIDRHWERAIGRTLDAGIAPVHATATANLRRLSRAKQR